MSKLKVYCNVPASTVIVITCVAGQEQVGKQNRLYFEPATSTRLPITSFSPLLGNW